MSCVVLFSQIKNKETKKKQIKKQTETQIRL